jgi:hypothetical protein
MSYISQETKKEISTNLKTILAKYKIKASLAVEHHSLVSLNIYSSPIDFIGNYNKVAGQRYANQHFEPVKDYFTVNHFWYKEQFDGIALECLTEIINVLNRKNGVFVEDSDYGIVPDYYIHVNIGKWNKPYLLRQ